MQLETKRTLIRKFTLSDVDPLHKVLSNPKVMEYIEEPYTLEKTKEFIIQAGLCNPPLVYALELKSAKRVIGHVIYRKFDEKSDEIGWIIDQDHWGKGLADEITKGIISYSKRHSDARSLVIECDPAQRTTEKIALKNGFTDEGIVDGLRLFRRQVNRRDKTQSTKPDQNGDVQ